MHTHADIDFENTGLSPGFDRMIEVAIGWCATTPDAG